MIDFNEEPPRFAICDEEGMDETDVNLQAYISNLPAERLAQYNASWTDQEVIAWDENFRDDGHLLLVCCTRDVDVEEYRQALEAHLAQSVSS
jgi:hypothetical protein